MTIESPGQLSPKLYSVQALRAVAALMVLLYHLVNTSAFGWKASNGALQQPAALVSAIGFAGVDLFFVISGLVMTTTCYERLGQRGQWAPFLARRAARIYPLYWLVTLAVLAICWVRPELAARDKFTWPTLLKSILLWPQEEYPILAVGWTLTYELFFYLVFAGLLMAPRRLFVPMLAVWACGTTVLFTLYRDPAHVLTSEGHLSLPLFASPLALEFIAGCLVGVLARQGAAPLAPLALIAGMITLICGGGAVGMSLPVEAQYGLLRAAVYGGSALLIVYGAVGLELQGKLRTPKWLMFLGDASYSTYLTHMYVLWFVAGGLLTFANAMTLDPWVRTLIGVAACTAAAVICHLLIERPIMRLSKRLLRPIAFGSCRPAPAG